MARAPPPGSDLFIPQPFYVIGHRQPKSTVFRLSAAAGGGPPTGMSTTLQQRYQYRRRLPHLQKPDADLFITFCTARLKLPASARDVVLEHSLREGGVLARWERPHPNEPWYDDPRHNQQSSSPCCRGDARSRALAFFAATGSGGLALSPGRHPAMLMLHVRPARDGGQQIKS